jgi:hypothetical protein
MNTINHIVYERMGLEDETGVDIPEDVRWWLQKSAGGS